MAILGKNWGGGGGGVGGGGGGGRAAGGRRGGGGRLRGVGKEAGAAVRMSRADARMSRGRLRAAARARVGGCTLRGEEGGGWGGCAQRATRGDARMSRGRGGRQGVCALRGRGLGAARYAGAGLGAAAVAGSDGRDDAIGLDGRDTGGHGCAWSTLPS
jgi:hypothetical protein